MKKLIAALCLAALALSAQAVEFNAQNPDAGADSGNLPQFTRTWSLTGTWQRIEWTESFPFRVGSIQVDVNTTNELGMTNVFRMFRNRTASYDGATNTWWGKLVEQGCTNVHTMGLEPFAFTIESGDWFMFTNTQAGLNVTLSAGKR